MKKVPKSCQNMLIFPSVFLQVFLLHIFSLFFIFTNETYLSLALQMYTNSKHLTLHIYKKKKKKV